MAKSLALDPRKGYLFAILNMVISGAAINVNSIGVRSFSDSTLYKTLKNSLAGIVLLAVLAFSSRLRAECARLGARAWALLLVVSLIGGSIPYALYFHGLQLTSPVTASLCDGRFVSVPPASPGPLRPRPPL